MITYLSCMMMLALVVAGHSSNYFKRQKYGNSTRSNGFKKGLQLQRLEKLQKIYGGNFVDSITEYPYMAFIIFKIDDHERTWCTGTILSPKYVLTAAHCLRQCLRDESTRTSNCNDRKSEQFTIFLGNVVPKHATKVKVKRYVIHPEYQRFDEENKCENNYYIAIMELEKPIKLSKTMSAVNLPTSVNNGHNMKNCEMIGWGLTEEEEEDIFKRLPYLDRRLKYTSSDVISIEECIDHLKISEADYSIYPDNVCRATHMCTIDPKDKRGTCQGDSGGPLICNGVQVGIASMGATKGCVGPHIPTVYERVDINLKWIKHIIAKV